MGTATRSFNYIVSVKRVLYPVFRSVGLNFIAIALMATLIQAHLANRSRADKAQDIPIYLLVQLELQMHIDRNAIANSRHPLPQNRPDSCSKYISVPCHCHIVLHSK